MYHSLHSALSKSIDIVDGLIVIEKHREQSTSVSKDESTEFMITISKRVQRSTQWLVHGRSTSGSIGLPEAVHHVVSKGAILVIHRESTVPTVEVLLQLIYIYILNNINIYIIISIIT